MKTCASLAAGLAIAALSLSGCGPSATGDAAPSTSSGPSTTAPTTPLTASAPATSSETTTPPATSAPATTPASTTPSLTTATPSTTPTATAAPATPSPTTTKTPVTLMAAGASGDRVRELQSRLKQLQWYDGDVTGTYGETTTASVRGFQDKRGLPETGQVDQLTWDRLGAQTRKPTDDEIHNRLTPGPALLKLGGAGDVVKELQARLKQIGWWSGAITDTYGPQTVAAVTSFQDRRGLPVTGEVDQRTIDRLRAMTRTPTSDEINNVQPQPPTTTTAGLDSRCLTGHVICISKATRSLTWVVDGQPQRRMDVRFGSENNPTREGDFPVYRMNRDWTSTLYGSKMPYSMFFSGGEAVHYSSDFAERGYAGASHGCVNVRDLGGIAWLFDQVKMGDRVVVY